MTDYPNCTVTQLYHQEQPWEPSFVKVTVQDEDGNQIGDLAWPHDEPVELGDTVGVTLGYQKRVAWPGEKCRSCKTFMFMGHLYDGECDMCRQSDLLFKAFPDSARSHEIMEPARKFDQAMDRLNQILAATPDQIEVIRAELIDMSEEPADPIDIEAAVAFMKQSGLDVDNIADLTPRSFGAPTTRPPVRRSPFSEAAERMGIPPGLSVGVAAGGALSPTIRAAYERAMYEERLRLEAEQPRSVPPIERPAVQRRSNRERVACCAVNMGIRAWEQVERLRAAVCRLTEMVRSRDGFSDWMQR